MSNPNMKRGAVKSPRHRLLAAIPFRGEAAPAQFAIVPKLLSPWGNQTYGDCVSAEEAYAKACWSIQCGLPETFITEAEVIRWARKYGFLNGADLSEVMDAMARDGMNVNGVNYKDGMPRGVDYSNEAILQSAIATGPVKIAIDANALPSNAGNGNGWWTIASGHYGNTDHCVGLSGFGTALFIFQQFNLPLPAGLNPSTPGYILFTWNSVGFVTRGWLMGTCVEAWVRTPTTPGQNPAPTPSPVPPVLMPYEMRLASNVSAGAFTMTINGNTVSGYLSSPLTAGDYLTTHIDPVPPS